VSASKTKKGKEKIPLGGEGEGGERGGGEG